MLWQTETPGMSVELIKKDKYLQIFNYLLEFSKLRSNPVRNIESSDTQYPDKIWLSDIPQYEIFDSITFPSYNPEADYWLKINKPKEEPQKPSFPKLGELLSDWIVNESLTEENGTPILKDSITKNGKTISLIEKPEVDKEFQAYLNNKWIDDLELYRKEYEIYESKFAHFEKQLKIYKHLFSIYNKTEQFGEEYELIIGVGLLHFQEDSNTPLICRHILTSKAEITFEFSAKESYVKVSPSIDNEMQIETDSILDLSEQFDLSDIIDAEKKLGEFLKEKNITDSPFDKHIFDGLQIFADRLRTDGQSKDNLSKSTESPKKPTVFFAPALLLRKRNTRSFTALYEKIIENITTASDSIDIPSINDIICLLQNPDDASTDSENGRPSSVGDETIYFPKKYNDEQIEIIEKSRRNNKVLVQGPPGTGKSHTIANLICHLLANGKKVLVTAYTKRALEVLKNQLPTDFQNLTVNLLSGDSGSIQDLDASVNAINDELSRVTNLDSFKKQIEKKETELSTLKADRAKTINQWLTVKEQSSRRQNINRNYHGTLSEVAEIIEKEIPDYAWFKDEFSDISNTNVAAEIAKFVTLTKHYQSIDCSGFKFEIPNKKKLISLSELKEYQKISQTIAQKYPSKQDCLSINCKDYADLKRQLQEIQELFCAIEKNDLPFKMKLVNEFQSNLPIWKDRLSRTANSLVELTEEKLKQLDRSVEITYPSGKSLIQLKSDANALLSYLKSGNTLSGIWFNIKKLTLPASIKERLYFIDEVIVNGSPCYTEGEFQTVLHDIKTKQDFDELKNIWGIEPSGNLKSYYDKGHFYQQLKAEAENLIVLLDSVSKIKAKIESFSSVRINGLESAVIDDLISETDYNSLLAQARLHRERIAESNKHLSSQNINPIGKEMSKALADLDVDSYEQQYLKIDYLVSEQEDYTNYKLLKAKLEEHFPHLLKEIVGNTFEQSNLQQLEKAVHFKHAFVEIKNLLADDLESKLTYKISDLERQEASLISTIASKKAWLSVLEGLNKNFSLRQHLQAWVQAVKKIGKTGTGKRALKFRKEAQVQMEKCKDSVPCWVMPLYKVAETINPQQGMYDYVIIDEASQLGADAIFLLYISKKIIIVGDDKQTSPEYVGVETNSMTPYISKHLQNIPFANYYGTEFSFFDHAKRFCQGMTVLREHFRCMPEIIEFCNKHFYAPEGKGLYPLKQYSENRIDPLKAVYCESGYVDGTSANITNRVEAESIANKIAELITLENYKGKSFGIIGLQGNKQAALIENVVIKKIGEVEFKKRNIICGTSASFQGDERDIMFLSLVTAHNHNRAALTKPEDERRFNVAVSRAKEQVWLFHSVLLDDLSNTNDLRHKLLDHFLNYRPQSIPTQRTYERTMGTQPEPFESWFEVDVYNDIVTNNYSVIPQYEAVKGRYRIDLVTILPNGIKIAIECDGDKFHGAEQFQNDLMRQKVLERCGWQFFRVRGGEYYSNRKKALEPLWKLLHANNIRKEELPVTNGQEKVRHEEIKNEVIVENVQPEIIKQPVVLNRKTELPDLFRKETQSALNFTDKVHVEGKMKSSTNLFLFPEILVFTTSHNVYKVQNNGLTSQAQVISEIEFEGVEKPIYFTGTKNYSGYLIVAFQNGKVGKISMESFRTEQNRKRLKNAYNDESKLIFIEHLEGDIDLVALSNINKVVLFNTNQINSVDSRNTKGIQLMKQKDGSYMTKIKRLAQVKMQDPEYYRKEESLNVVGYYLKPGDEV